MRREGEQIMGTKMLMGEKKGTRDGDERRCVAE